MRKIELKPSEALYPVPVVLVSCSDKTSRRANIITIAWCGVVCSVPPLISVSIRRSRYSHKLIRDAGDFVINIPTKDILKQVDLCGIRSGRDTNKFRDCGFTEEASSVISSAMIKECPVNIECRLKDITDLGSHDMFIGQVLKVHVNSDILDENGSIDYTKASPLVYTQGSYREVGKEIGRYGFSSK
jgi:flavin reductase (DIM6/NTAB) family NADH-FMN oxidoreductase RutF